MKIYLAIYQILLIICFNLKRVKQKNNHQYKTILILHVFSNNELWTLNKYWFKFNIIDTTHTLIINYEMLEK